MSDVIKGAASALIGTRRNSNPSTGISTTSVYQFARQTDAQAFFAGVADAGYLASIDDKGPVYTVEYTNPTAADGSAEVPVDLWEMPPVNQEIPIWQIQEYKNMTSDTDRAALRAYDQSYPETTPAFTPNSDAAEILTLLQNGTDHVQSPTVSLRWTRTVSNSWSALGDTYVDVGIICKPSALLSLGPPALIAAAITAATNQRLAVRPSGSSADYRTGWLKQQSTITQRGLNKFDIVQEWILETWSIFLYGTPV